MEEEGIRGSVLSIAQATKTRPQRGQVIAQVKWITKTGTINPRDVDVPEPLEEELSDFIVTILESGQWGSKSEFF